MKHSFRLRLCRTEFFQPCRWRRVQNYRFESVLTKFTRPSYLVGSPEEGKLGLQVLVDLVECELLAGHGLNGHDDEGDVAIRRLLLAAGACGGSIRIHSKTNVYLNWPSINAMFVPMECRMDAGCITHNMVYGNNQKILGP